MGGGVLVYRRMIALLLITVQLMGSDKDTARLEGSAVFSVPSAHVLRL